MAAIHDCFSSTQLALKWYVLVLVCIKKLYLIPTHQFPNSPRLSNNPYKYTSSHHLTQYTRTKKSWKRECVCVCVCVCDEQESQWVQLWAWLCLCLHPGEILLMSSGSNGAILQTNPSLWNFFLSGVDVRQQSDKEHTWGLKIGGWSKTWEKQKVDVGGRENKGTPRIITLTSL